jgi:hypothetical protein
MKKDKNHEVKHTHTERYPDDKRLPPENHDTAIPPVD